MKKVLSWWLCIAIALCCTGCTGSSKGDNSAEEKIFTIETPYCSLRYPEKWQDAVGIAIDSSGDYTVMFSADGMALFDLTFGGGDGDVLGTLRTDDRNTVLRITSYNLDRENKNYLTYCMMQEDVNIILSHLISEYNFAVGEEIQDEDSAVFEIKTSIGPLYYPQQWEERISVEVQDASVKFSCDGMPLFDLQFGEGEGYLLGSYQDTPVYIVSYDIEQGSLSDQEYITLCAMREDINVVLQHLMADSNFALSS